MTDTDNYDVTHTVSRLKLPCSAWAHSNFSFAFQLINIGLLNTARFQNFKYSDQGNFRTTRSTFISHSSRNIRVYCQATRYQQCQVAT